MNKTNMLLAMGITSALLSPLTLASENHGDHGGKKPKTTTPIEHVIVIVGENHTFDNLFGAWKPQNGAKVNNLLAKGIINADGTPGPNFNLSAQQQASDSDSDGYSLAPAQTGPYASLPPVNTTYATNLTPGVDDTRYPANLPNGPYQLTNALAPITAYFGDPVHRFFQMWQQFDQGKHDLFVWVAETIGIGSQNFFPGGPFLDNSKQAHTFQGGLAMGFFNMSTGDAPIFKSLAEQYAVSDNYHQFIMGGTGANFIGLVTGDAGFFTSKAIPPAPMSTVRTLRNRA
jgi:phospholipase C